MASDDELMIRKLIRAFLAETDLEIREVFAAELDRRLKMEKLIAISTELAATIGDQTQAAQSGAEIHHTPSSLRTTRTSQRGNCSIEG